MIRLWHSPCVHLGSRKRKKEVIFSHALIIESESMCFLNNSGVMFGKSSPWQSPLWADHRWPRDPRRSQCRSGSGQWCELGRNGTWGDYTLIKSWSGWCEHCIPDQGLEDGVSSVGHQAGVPLHLGPQLGHVSAVIRVNITFIVTTKICIALKWSHLGTRCHR